MAKRPDIPLHMFPKTMFAPANGTNYIRGEMCRIFAQQPIKGPGLPFKYLVPSPSTTLKPPTLRYGWRLGHEKLMDIAYKHFKEAVKYRFAPATEGLDEDEEIEYSPEDYEVEQANIMDTLMAPDYIVAIQDLLGLPDWATDYINIQPLYDSQHKYEWGLTVGSNYPPGVLRADVIAKLEEILETDEPAMWYLDFHEWQWYRLPALPKPETKKTRTVTQSNGKTKAATVRKTVDKGMNTENTENAP